MRISDWSSDVCSSDLACLRFLRTGRTAAQVFRPSSIEPPPRASAPGRTTPRRQRRGTPAGVSTRRGSTLSSRISPLAPQPPAKRDKAAGGDHQPAEPDQRDERLPPDMHLRSEEHTSELQSLMRISYAVFCLKNKTNKQ